MWVESWEDEFGPIPGHEVPYCMCCCQHNSSSPRQAWTLMSEHMNSRPPAQPQKPQKAQVPDRLGQSHSSRLSMTKAGPVSLWFPLCRQLFFGSQAFSFSHQPHRVNCGPGLSSSPLSTTNQTLWFCFLSSLPIPKHFPWTQSVAESPRAW